MIKKQKHALIEDHMPPKQEIERICPNKGSKELDTKIESFFYENSIP